MAMIYDVYDNGFVCSQKWWWCWWSCCLFQKKNFSEILEFGLLLTTIYIIMRELFISIKSNFHSKSLLLKWWCWWRRMVRENILNFDFFLSGNCLSASVWWTWEGVGGWRMRKIGQKFPIVALLVTSFSFKPSLEICPQSSCESDQCQCNSQNKKPPETETHSHKGKTAGGSPRPAVQQGQHKNCHFGV